MANYRTHVTTGACVGAITAGAGMSLVPGVGWPVLILGTFLGFLGGTVPDLDHDHGRGLTKIMALLSTFVPVIILGSWFGGKSDWAGLSLLFLLPCHYILHWLLPETKLFMVRKKTRISNAILAIVVSSICCIPAVFFFKNLVLGSLYTWLLMVACGITVQLLVPLLRWTTVHRGVWHSIPVTIIYAELMYLFLSSFSLNQRLTMAAAAFAGALSHLILDEIYSVDFDGLRIKKSFGTAFKFWDAKSPMWSGFVYLSAAGLGVVCTMY